MIRRLIAVGLIFFCTSIAWMVLGGATLFRTYDTDGRLSKRVSDTWGDRHQQHLPRVTYDVETTREETVYNDGGSTLKTVKELVPRPLHLAGSDIRVNLQLEHRQKGLLWYPTYTSDFSASYRFINNTGQGQDVQVSFGFPARNSVFDDFVLELEGAQWRKSPEVEDWSYKGQLHLPAGGEFTLKTAYRSQGMQSWKYIFGDGVSRVRDFRLVMITDFHDIDFPPGTLSAPVKNRTDAGWELIWEYKNLLSGVDIGMALPNKLQPGPLAGRISFFAPVSLFFFILMVLVIALLKNIGLHPMHFFFLSAAFFAFHLLVAYLADHISIHLAFALSSLISVGLVVSYLWKAIGPRFALVYAGPVQLVYLVLFSYTFFFKGYTGLAITLGAVLTLLVMMQTTARVDWEAVYRPKETTGK